MGLFTDNDKDGVAWDDTLDRAAMVGGAALTPVGGAISALGVAMFGAGCVPEPASPALIPGGLALAFGGGALGGLGAGIGIAGQQGMVGDAVQAVGDFFAPPKPPSLADVLGQGST